MRTARMTLNSYCFKKSIDFILGSCNWVDVDEMIKMSALKFINNVLVSQTPGTLYSKLKINKRTCSNISFKYFPKLTGFKCTILYRGIHYYNQLPTDFKLLQRKKFKEKLKNERHILKQLLDQVVMVRICYQGKACHHYLKDAPYLNCTTLGPVCSIIILI